MDRDTFLYIKGLVMSGYYGGLREVEGEDYAEDYNEDEIDEECE